MSINKNYFLIDIDLNDEYLNNILIEPTDGKQKYNYCPTEE
jgi:hypothetical protein